MIINDPSLSLRIFLGGTPSSELNWYCSFVDTVLPLLTKGATNSTTPVVMISGTNTVQQPPQNSNKHLYYFSLKNISNADQIVTIDIYDGSISDIQISITLKVGYHLFFADGEWYVLDTFGRRETVSTTIPLASGEYGLLGVLLGADMNTTADQLILLSAGSAPIDCVIRNTSVTLTTATGGKFFIGISHSGIQLFDTTIVSGDGLQLLVFPQDFISVLNQTITNSQAGIQAKSVILSCYFSLDVAEGSSATADIYIYGYKN